MHVIGATESKRPKHGGLTVQVGLLGRPFRLRDYQKVRPPHDETVRKAMEKTRGGHASMTAQDDPAAN